MSVGMMIFFPMYTMFAKIQNMIRRIYQPVWIVKYLDYKIITRIVGMITLWVI